MAFPWCPSCNNEYRDGFAKCGECDTELLSDEAYRNLEMEELEEEELVVIDQGNLEYIKEQKDLLLDNQISSIYRPRSDEECKACVPTFQLLIVKDQLEAAREILSNNLYKLDRSDDGYDDNIQRESMIDYNEENISCPACGCEFALQQDCPECGLFIGVPSEEE